MNPKYIIVAAIVIICLPFIFYLCGKWWTVGSCEGKKRMKKGNE